MSSNGGAADATRFAPLTAALFFTLAICCCSSPAIPEQTAALAEAGPIVQTIPTPDPLISAWSFVALATPCQGGPPVLSFCAASVPDGWRDADKLTVLDLVRALVNEPKTRPLVQTVVDGGYKYFYKFRWAFDTEDRKVFSRAQRAEAWIGVPPRAISFSQRFIDESLGSDAFAGFDRKQFVLLHEMFHAIDRVRKYSDTTAFQDAFNASLAGVDRRSCQNIRDTFVILANSGRDAEGWNQMRRQVRALSLDSTGRALPSAVACLTTNDRFQEAFAEYGAFWYLDHSASKNFLLPMAVWFQTTFPR